jgi:hypothetical protein
LEKNCGLQINVWVKITKKEMIMLSRRKFLAATGFGIGAAAVGLTPSLTNAQDLVLLDTDPYQVWELIGEKNENEDRPRESRLIGEVVAPDLVQAVKVARQKYPNRALRVCGSPYRLDKRLIVEVEANSTEPNMEELYRVIHEEEDFAKMMKS